MYIYIYIYIYVYIYVYPNKYHCLICDEASGMAEVPVYILVFWFWKPTLHVPYI